VSRDLGTGRVVAVMQKKESADELVVCVCCVSRSVREELAAGCSDNFPAFFVAHESGSVGVYSDTLAFLFTLNRVPHLRTTGAAGLRINCLSCALGNDNSVLLLGLDDGRIVLYDLDGGDAAQAVTSAVTVYRSQPLVIEEASSSGVSGLQCYGTTFALARSRFCVKLLDVRRSRKVVAAATVTHEKSIVAAVFKHTARVCLILQLQVICF
jgi:hypothetical protein